MNTKGPFVVESFVNIGSFDCDCKHALSNKNLIVLICHSVFILLIT